MVRPRSPPWRRDQRAATSGLFGVAQLAPQGCAGGTVEGEAAGIEDRLAREGEE